jgi:cytochrome oxidase Cu insertion factor (SCO1/SenC/PrrC family)
MTDRAPGASPSTDTRTLRGPLARTDPRNRRTLYVLAAIAIAPVVASYVAYYFFPREARVNYGALIAAPAPAIEGKRFDGTPFRLDELRGRWVLLIAGGERCEAACTRMLYATRQARTIQGREQDRIVRAVLLTGDEPPQPDVLAEHPGLVAAHGDEASFTGLPIKSNAIYLVDPLGNLVLRYSDDPDIKRLAKDLERVLRASSVG